MRNVITLAAIIGTSLLLAACGSSVGNGPADPGGSAAGPTPMGKTEFSGFVKGTLTDPAWAAPRELNDISFEDSESPDAFDDVL